MNLLQSLVRSWAPPGTVTFNGNTYPLTMPQTTLGFREEAIEPNYSSFAQLAYQANPVIFACMEVRRALFSEARFQWRQVRGGTPGKLFGTSALKLLEQPWPGATTGDLLSRAIQDADLAGNAFIVRRRGQLTLLRPDWMTIVAASDTDEELGLAAIDARVIGYAYYPGGRGMQGDPVILLPEEVAHFAPIPDPLARFRGMSWLTPLIRDVMADQAASQHKLKFFENGATPNMVVIADKESAAAQSSTAYDMWVDMMKRAEPKGNHAYRTLYLANATADVVGSHFKEIEFGLTQAKGETRIAAAAGVPPILAGLSEGLASGTYSNYGMARRRFSDGTIWPLWANMAGSLETILPPPSGAQLWVDGRDIPFLQEDEKDRATIQQMDAAAINTLVTAGYDPVSVVDAVTAGDLVRLKHSGLYSVQLQPPGSKQELDAPADPQKKPVEPDAAKPLAPAA
jgi:phage portal protein BeeE